ncbi:MAG TPA: YebC/PmpR family DNA-binding transcriptional regulator [Candidatus Baltobacteraceae bacterium]|jgi:YebC/PmpR family DNA-binding regulatory protein
MSGHSKWHNIKLRKGKADAQRGALFSKLSKEIILAAKSGSTDPEANYRLKMAVEKARENNVPADNIKRAIARAAGEGERDIEEIRYEGYGPAGLAVVIDAATDNRNRTASEIRFLFTRNEGNLGETGSVGWMFDARGFLDVENAKLDEDGLTEKALFAGDGVIDVRFGAERSEILTEDTALGNVREALSGQGLRVTDAYVGMEPKQPLHAEGETLRKMIAFLDALEEHEDVQRVYSNLHLDEAQVEALARA